MSNLVHSETTLASSQSLSDYTDKPKAERYCLSSPSCFSAHTLGALKGNLKPQILALERSKPTN